MTPDLLYLAFTAILTASLWIVYIASQVKTNGFLAPQNYRDPSPRSVPLWGTRAHRAYLNAIEAFAPFAALVLVAHVADRIDATMLFLIMSYFWLRVVHAVVYWFAIPYIRTLSFTLGYLCVLGIFIHLVF